MLEQVEKSLALPVLQLSNTPTSGKLQIASYTHVHKKCDANGFTIYDYNSSPIKTPKPEYKKRRLLAIQSIVTALTNGYIETRFADELCRILGGIALARHPKHGSPKECKYIPPEAKHISESGGPNPYHYVILKWLRDTHKREPLILHLDSEEIDRLNALFGAYRRKEKDWQEYLEYMKAHSAEYEKFKQACLLTQDSLRIHLNYKSSGFTVLMATFSMALPSFNKPISRMTSSSFFRSSPSRYSNGLSIGSCIGISYRQNDFDFLLTL